MLNFSQNYHITSPVIALFTITAASNYLVEFSINDWLTWGAFSYPLSFLVTELTNRSYGPQVARKAVYIAFFFAVLLAFICMNRRIAIASSLAFLCGQLLDIAIFNRLRQSAWWLAPGVSSVVASLLDTGIFFTVAFIGEPVPWVTLAAGDFGIKLLMDLAMLLPFRLLMQKKTPWQTALLSQETLKIALR